VSEYDPIAHLYDPWSASVTEDIDFYASLAVEAGSPVVELGVGTGRIAVPTALAGVRVIGVDRSAGMLHVCREAAVRAGVSDFLDLREGDLRHPPVTERVRLVTCPFRAYLHLTSDEDRLEALRAARRLLVPGGRLVFDIFEPSDEDVESTQARWLEREPGIFERADWDLGTRTLTLSLRSGDDASTMELAWLSPPEWRTLLEQAGFRVEAHYGWFDRRPWQGGEDSVWVAVRPDE
jgi:ubiquinone/menaquinone biosynthesis C-methylase UbiE